MLTSCSHVLSQGDGSDFHPGCNWEATPPGYSICVRAWKWLAPHHRATPAQTYCGSPEKLEKIRECSQVYWLWEELEMGPQRKIGWDLNPGTVAMTRRTTWLWVSLCHTAYEAGKQDVAAIADLSLSSFERMQERCWGKEKGERTLAGRQWEGAMWFWIKNWRFRWYSWWCWEPREAYQLSRDYWGNLSHGSLFLFLRCGTLHQAKGVRKDCVCLWVF